MLVIWKKGIKTTLDILKMLLKNITKKTESYSDNKPYESSKKYIRKSNLQQIMNKKITQVLKKYLEM